MGCRYAGFLSYSHAVDGRLAPAIQSALHRLGRPWYRLTSTAIFRDKNSLCATPHLWETIESALQESECFILLATPESAASHWVRREIEWWLEHRSSQTMLIAVTSGEISWDSGQADFDWVVTDALPGLLSR